MPTGIYTRPLLGARLAAQSQHQPNGCVDFIGSTNGRGYGLISLNNRHIRAHRAAWMLANGEIPPGKMVLHRCDNRKCVNPEHLWLGTAADNAADMVHKGRTNGPRGKRNFNTKLTEADVSSIRAAPARYGYRKELARRFGVSVHTISGIRNWYSWRYLGAAK